MGVSDKNVTNYRRELNLQTGIASTKFDHKGVTYTREHFVSEPDNVMVTELSASEMKRLTIGIKMHLSNSNLNGKTTFNKNTNICTIDGTVNDNGLKFRTTMKIVLDGGTLKLDEEKQTYFVEDANNIKIIMAAETDYKNDYPTYRDTEKDLIKTVDERVEKATDKSYAELKENHLSDHQEMFDRVSLDLDEDYSDIPTNQLVENYRNKDYSKYLEVLSYQYGRYLTIAGSRGQLPSNLVGLWTVGRSGWSGDYHFNVNIQMNYWPIFINNLADVGTSYVDFMENLREPGRLTAERIHGIKDATTKKNGFTVHTENNPFGMTAPSQQQEYGWNPTGAAWAVQNLWWYYEFTQDKNYLQSVIYPIMKEATLFWDNYLYESEYQIIDDETSKYNGGKRLVVAPSFSAEQGPTVNGSTYDQSLVWELYNDSIKAGEIVGEDEALLNEWRDKLQRLDPININSTGEVKEWYEETRVGTESGHNKSYAAAGDIAEVPVPNSGWNIGHPGEHRHASNLVGLFPGTLINKNNETYMNAAIKSLEERGFYSTGWSKANKVNLWARTGDGNNAYKTLNNLIGGKASGLQYNLFDSHGSGGGETMKDGTPIFQIDGNYGLTSGVGEMLLQSHLGYTEFLPAIPDSWDEGEVYGLKARGNFTIGQKWSNGLADKFTVQYDGPENSSKFIGAYKNITNANVTADGKEIEFTIENDNIVFEAQKGVKYTINMSNTNIDDLVEQANNFLEQIHPDLLKVKMELEEAIKTKDEALSTIFQKAKKMNQIYLEYLKDGDKVYLLTIQEGLSNEDIDKIYLTLREMYNAIIGNEEDLDYYKENYSSFSKAIKTCADQMENRVISFSKETGIVGSDRSLTLSKNSKVSYYDIRYTTDGSQPNFNSTLYQSAIELAGDNCIVRAALFYGEQRVSPIYTNSYTNVKANINSIYVEVPNWGAEYIPEKMFDGNTSTRWASKLDKGNLPNPLEIVLNLNQNQEINKISFDAYVSRNNGIGNFDILAEIDGTFQKVYEGKEMASATQTEGHGYYLASFEKVKTSKIKISLKSGYVGEPSFYEITPLLVPEVSDGYGDTELLNEMVKRAEAIDRNADNYLEADENLRKAFDESILDGKSNTKFTQAEIDSRELFVRSRYNRLGFGEVDKSELIKYIKQAEEAKQGSYTRDSIYRLNKILMKAQDVNDDEKVNQPTVDNMVRDLKKSLAELESNINIIKVPSHDATYPAGWIEVSGYMATSTKDASEPLSFTFNGTGIACTTVKADDHGIFQVVITNSNGNEVYNEKIDTYTSGDRVNGDQLINISNLPYDKYTINFSHAGVNSSSTGYGWVEVGEFTVYDILKEEVDRSSLEVQLDIYENLIEKDYTKESWNKLQEIIKKAIALNEKDDIETCTTEMQDMALEVEDSIKELVEYINIYELTNILDEAKAIKEDGYTSESYAKLKECINDVESFLEGSYTKEEVAMKVSKLQQCINDLKVDKTILQNKYDEIKNFEQNNITDESWKEFLKLKEKVEYILNDNNATIKEVTDILNEIENFEFKYNEEVDKPSDGDKPFGGDTPLDQDTSHDNSLNDGVSTGDTIATESLIILFVITAGMIVYLKSRKQYE